MDVIFMLTRYDETVEDCLDVWAAVEGLGLTHAGFKDVGVDEATLAELNRRMQSSGVITCLEVVSTTPEERMRSARVAVDLGVDWLMGGTDLDEVPALLAGTGISYLPFPGVPIGHPTVLGGSADTVEAHCKAFDAAGCAGVDLLAYRALDADPLDLVRAARRATTGTLVVAGSVSTVSQIDELRECGVDAFTIGSAVFDGAFSLRKGLTRSQLSDVMEAARG